MRIGIPKEERPGETLVAATPKTAAKLIALGYDVMVEAGAGAAAKFPDGRTSPPARRSAAPARSGRRTSSPRSTSRPRTRSAARRRRDGHRPDVAGRAPRADRGAAGQAGDRTELLAIPRISRAQSMDVLSTMSNIAGYRGVIEAAESYGGMFGGQVTAAGKTQPATVFVIGAGVAGLAAIGAAVSLGAQVRAFDVRPEVGEQIESMGATFVTASRGAAAGIRRRVRAG